MQLVSSHEENPDWYEYKKRVQLDMKTMQLVSSHEENPDWYEYKKRVQLDMQ